MSRLELIGVPFDGFGRTGHQARAAQALRDAGLEGAFGEHEVLAGPDLVLPPPDPRRAPGSGLMNEAALLAMVQAVHGRVSEALAVQRFPVIYGGECSALLGAVSGLGTTGGRPGLVFVDAHEDTTPLDVSVDGEAANMELGLLLGITGQLAPPALRSVLPALDPAALAVLGPRDQELRRKCNVASLADRNIHLRRHDAVAVDPAEVARKAVEHVRKTAPSWWLHIDLDVIAQGIFTAGRVPGDEDEEGGLNWAQLTELTTSAFASGGCAGWSIVIYDPEQDENGSQARRIVEFVSKVSSALPRRP